MESALFLTVVLLLIKPAEPLELGCGAEPADIIFVLDESGSVGPTNFESMKDFVVSIVRQFTIGPDEMRIGLLNFASWVRPQFNLKKYKNGSAVEDAISRVYFYSGGTNTAAALDYVRQYSFNVTNGGRANAKRVVVILTDGQSNSETATLIAAEKLLNTGVTVFSIGVGGGPRKSELDAMASDPDKYYSFILTDFGGLVSIVDALTKKTCNDLFPFGDKNGDQKVGGDDEASLPIEIETGVPFGNEKYYVVYVSTNGVMSFERKFKSPNSEPFKKERLTKVPMIAGFWTDLTAEKQTNGTLYHNKYERSKNASVVDKASLLVNTYYEIDTFSASIVIVATWYNMTQFLTITSYPNETITFQMVLCSDGTETYVLLIYSEINLRLVLDRRYIIGYNKVNPHEYFNHLFSDTKLVFEMDEHGDPKRGRRGFWPMKVSDGGTAADNSAQECYDWYGEESKSLEKYERWSDELECPCFRLWAQFDERLAIHTPDCYIFSACRPYSKICCYDGFFLQTKIPDAGSLVTYCPQEHPKLHEENDLQPLGKCCIQSHFCSLYYKVRPQGKCYVDPPFDTAIIWGDPHIGTIDGKRYTFNGLGEYTLFKVVTVNDTVNIQARTDYAKTANSTSANATIFSSVAGKDNKNANFQVDLSSDRKSMQIFINGADRTGAFYAKKNFSLFDKNIFVNRKENETLVITLMSGCSIAVSVGVDMLTMQNSVPKKFRDHLVGLVGNFNGDPDDDFKTPDGTVLSTNSSEREIYFNFGQKWQIKPDESIFKYPTGKGPSDYSHPGFIPIFSDEFPLSLEKRKEAEIVCGGSDNKECIVDYIVTGDKEVAGETKDIIFKELEEEKLLSNNIPSLFIDKRQIQVTVGQTVVLNITAYDPDDDDSATVKILDKPDRNFNFDSTRGRAVWNPTDASPTLIRIGAVDTKGAATEPVIIKITMCTGCSGNGVCIMNETRADASSTSTYFSLNTCDCQTGWEGADCEADTDGCAQGLCHQLQKCFDLTPSEEAMYGRGYNCSACPVGYISVDGKCRDVDECRSNPCGQLCHNTVGSYYCSCNAGYQLHEGVCQNVNECLEGTHDCKQVCRDANGTFTCDCHYGFNLLGDQKSCKQYLDFCAISGLTCEVGCENTTGNPRCFCERGYELASNRQDCQDLDECQSSANQCEQNCENTVGGFSCSCDAGYMLNSNNQTCDACEVPYYGENCTEICICGDRSVDCDKVSGCVCIPGYRGIYCEANIDECKEDPNICGSDQLVCVDNDGSYACNCPTGYRKKLDGTCEDINECDNAASNTCDDSTQKCVNTVGSYSCECEVGFERGDNNTCTDIDECEAGSDGCEQKCENLGGTYNCYCEFGFLLTADRKNCTKVSDPCKSLFNITCGYACKIVDISGVQSAECYCPSKYELHNDTVTCLDIDECSNNDTNQCSHKDRCVNIDGGYKCSCPNGYRLDNNQRTCMECDSNHWGKNCANECGCGIGASTCDRLLGCVCKPGWNGTHCSNDLNECLTGSNCSENFLCVNNPGSYRCECTGGFVLNSTLMQCNDIDECDSNETNSCQYKEQCINTIGSFTCGCPAGYSFVTINRTCVDVDECESVATNGCEYKDRCINTDGNYTCSCPTGYLLENNERNCTDQDECDSDATNQCEYKDTCVNTYGNYTCSCPSGYKLENNKRTCTDVDECESVATNGCEYRDRCINTDGNYTCSCPTGYLLENNKRNCTDVDECESVATNECEYKDRCINTDGNYTCSCPTGYLLENNKRNCTDQDECDSDATNQCEYKDTCVNTDGNYTCSCPSGYKLENNKRTCTDKNECDSVATNQCEYKDTCVNTVGNYTCSCPSGYKLENNKRTCTDQDECDLVATNQCEYKDTCVNTDGDYTCSCPSGYKLENNKRTCTDQNECDSVATNQCEYKDTCVNTDGDYTCSCPSGYKLENKRTCTDQNECDSVATNQCEYKDTCVNTDGDYTCSCPSGYKLGNNKRTCTDQNECDSVATNQCEYKDTCVNTDGDYTCSCPSGYKLGNNKRTCTDEDECGTAETNQCEYKDRCVNIAGDYTCSCPSGYTLEKNKRTCADINECDMDGENQCSFKYFCVNTDGDYTCSCPNGYKLENNKRTCSVISTQIKITVKLQYDTKLNVSDSSNKDVIKLKDEIQSEIVKHFNSKMTTGYLGVKVTGLRKGSLYVDYELQIMSQSQTYQEASKAVMALAGEKLNIMNTQVPVQLTQIGDVPVNSADSDPCIVRKVVSPCGSGFACEGGECKAIDNDNDTWALIIGFGVGIPGGLFCLTIIIVLVYFKRCSKKKKQSKTDNQPYRNSSRSDYPVFGQAPFKSVPGYRRSFPSESSVDKHQYLHEVPRYQPEKLAGSRRDNDDSGYSSMQHLYDYLSPEKEFNILRPCVYTIPNPDYD